MRHWNGWVVLLAAIGFVACAPEPEPAESEAPPNVVLIISDDQGWTDYGFMGHPDIETPHLDKLASESLLYTRGYVPTSLCRPSLASIMTGLYPHQHGITGNDPPGEMRDPDNRASMVEVFQKNRPLAGILADELGYVSHQSGKWWEGECQCGGFTYCMTHGDVTRGGRHGDEGLKIGRETMAPVFDFIDGAGEKPFFVWYAPFLPHTPHNPPERILSKYHAEGRPEAIAKYYAMVDWFDETVGQLVGHLEEKGLRENTVIAYVCDNGWVQTEDPQKWWAGRAKVSPYDAGLRTPIMFSWPGKIAAGRDDENLASSIDLAPTLLKAVGLEPDAAMPGLDLLDKAAVGERDRLYGALFAHTAVDVSRPQANLKVRWMLDREGWKLLVPHTPNAGIEHMFNGLPAPWMPTAPELYNVVADPFEKEDLAEAETERVARMMSDLQDWWPVEE